jgi:hypothetical protein
MGPSILFADLQKFGGEAAKVKLGEPKVQCLLQQISAEGSREKRRQAVAAFARRYPDQVQDSIDVLEKGGATAMSIFFDVALKISTAKPDEEENILAEIKSEFSMLTPEQTSQMDRLLKGREFDSLMKLMMGKSRFDERNDDFLRPDVITDAMAACNVSPADFD